MIGKLSARVVRSRTDLDSAYRLRHQVFVQEQKKAYQVSDSEESLLTDALDECSDVFVVEAQGTVVGTVRASWLDSAVVAEHYRGVLGLDAFSACDPAAMGVASRLAVAADCRDSTVRGLLFESIFRCGARRGTELCFAMCAPPILRLFRRYGFREYLPPVTDPIAGTLHRTILVVDDIDYLASVRSPFASLARQLGITQAERSVLFNQLSVALGQIRNGYSEGT